MSDNFTIRTSWLAGELAAAAGVSTDTLRHYERKGVLSRPSRTANGYRHYPENTLDRVLMVRRALAVGFTLDELAKILSEFDRGGAPCRQVRALAGEKLADVEEHIRALIVLRDELTGIVLDWDARLANTSNDTRAGLLRSLADGNQPAKSEKTKLPSSFKLDKRKSKK